MELDTQIMFNHYPEVITHVLYTFPITMTVKCSSIKTQVSLLSICAKNTNGNDFEELMLKSDNVLILVQIKLLMSFLLLFSTAQE